VDDGKMMKDDDFLYEMKTRLLYEMRTIRSPCQGCITVFSFIVRMEGGGTSGVLMVAQVAHLHGWQNM